MEPQESYSFGSEAADNHMSTVKDYLRKVNNGRSVKAIDPNQPAFSPEAETIRQVSAIDKANAKGDPQDSYSFQDAPESFDFSEGDTTSTPAPDRSTEGNSVRSKGTRETFKAAMDRYVPKGVIGKNDPNRDPAQALDPLFQMVTAPLAAARDTVLGGDPRQVADKVFGAPSTDWRKNVLPGIMEAGLDLLPGLPLLSIGARRGGSTAKPTDPTQPPVMPTPIQQGDLDAMVAHRSLTASAIDTGAFPDPDLIPMRRVPTGNNLTTPNLDLPQVEHTGSTLGPVERLAKGQFGRTGYPDLLPGETRAGQQEMYQGGYPAKDAPMGKTILTPEEQLPMGMDTLRPQVRTIPSQTSTQAGEIPKYIAKVLKTRVLTPEMERTLASPPETRGAAPLRVLPSKSGQSVSVEPAINEPFKLPGNFNVANTADGAVFPSLYTRVSGSVTDVMRAHGPIGNGIADMVDTAYANRAIGTSTDAIKATEAYDNIFGRTTRLQRAHIMFKQLLGGENAFLNGSSKNWGIPEKVQEQIFNYMYTKGRMKPSDPRAAQAGDALFQNMTFPASSDPGVRLLTITNPFTGKKISLGQPNMFMPQQPIHEITAQAIGDTQWRIAYERAGGEKLGISQNVYKNTIIKLSQHDPEVSAYKMKGLENMRLLDLESLGGSPYQWAKKLGYETDPFRAAFKFNSMARLRGQLAQIGGEENELGQLAFKSGPVNHLLMQVPAEANAANKWLHLATDRAFLNPGKYDALGTTTNTLKGISHMLDVTMLQLGGVANMAQAAYIVARGGARATIRGSFDLLKGVDRDIVERSGATFPAALNEMTNPTGPMATFSSGAFRLYGLSFVDRSTRYFAGHVGNQFIKQVERNLLQEPSSKRLQGLVSELGGDPKVLLQQGKLPDETRLSMIQRFANHTSGVTDVRGTPLWASTENPWARLVNKYRTFAVANSAELRRLVVNAPDVYTAAKRVSTLLAGAYVIGGGIHEARLWLRDSLLGNEAKPNKNDLSRNAERLVQGLGTIEGMFLVNAAQDSTRAMASLTGGPAGGVAASFLQDMIATAQHGPGWRTIDTASKRLPLVGPIVGPLVGAEVKRESRQTAENQKYLHE